ncbi:hypothetical protein [Clostridium sp.]|uniref:hypothetical protein n=1 Tax=Clostridium sp. TaxID=1506 RepID=UPI0025C4263A|nr:hypothetical protein [Clostridium sp.]
MKNTYLDTDSIMAGGAVIVTINNNNKIETSAQYSKYECPKDITKFCNTIIQEENGAIQIYNKIIMDTLYNNTAQRIKNIINNILTKDYPNDNTVRILLFVDNIYGYKNDTLRETLRFAIAVNSSSTLNNKLYITTEI